METERLQSLKEVNILISEWNQYADDFSDEQEKAEIAAFVAALETLGNLLSTPGCLTPEGVTKINSIVSSYRLMLEEWRQDIGIAS